MNLLRTLFKRPQLIAVLAVCVFFSVLISLSLMQGNPAPLTATVITPHKPVAEFTIPSPSLPVRLRIPKISVDAPIELMGLLTNGDMQAPDGPSNVGWYKYGALPGTIGSAVIAGHYGTWKNGSGSVFDNLNKLQKGDTIYVQDQTGATSTFVVRQFKMYGPDEVVPAIFLSSDGKAHLNLITCQGDWIQTQKSYSNRLVVFADKEI